MATTGAVTKCNWFMCAGIRKTGAPVDLVKKCHLIFTPQGQIVWEFYNPQTAEIDGKTQRAVIYRMMRITNPQDYPKVKELISAIKKTTPHRTIEECLPK